MIKLGYTSQATPKECEDGRLLHPVNVCRGGVSRDRSNPRRRTALGGNGMQWLELRSNVCGTVTTVNNFPIKREPSSSLEWPSVRKVARSARTPCSGSDGEKR